MQEKLAKQASEEWEKSVKIAESEFNEQGIYERAKDLPTMQTKE